MDEDEVILKCVALLASALTFVNNPTNGQRVLNRADQFASWLMAGDDE